MTAAPLLRIRFAGTSASFLFAIVFASTWTTIAYADDVAEKSVGEIATAYEAEAARYRAQLAELAAWCRERNLAAEEKRVAGWLPKREPDKSYFFLITPDVATPGDTVKDSEFAVRFRTLRNEHAERLFALARTAAKEQEYSTAVQLAYETLRENPLHEAALKLLGYQLLDGRRLSYFELTKRRAGQAWHAEFGWILQSHVARYEAGERYLSGKWVAAAEDARLHATIDRGWNIDTENFRVRTNHSLEEGVRLAERLEKMNQVWRQLFARYQTPEAEWKRLFDGGAPRELPRKRFNVVYFRTREEYVAALIKREPRIEITAGIFMNDDDTAYFFADPEKNNDPFLFHEVTHELFSLSKRTLNVGAKGNFWIVEGIACQMESLILHDDFAELGGVDNPRMRAARFRLLDTKFYVPLLEFTALTRTQMQSDSRIAMLYSQASGMASFLMYGEQGKYREATVDYLDAIYLGRDTPLTLTQRTGRSYAELDADYRRYIEALPMPAPAAPSN
ncbi:MAG: hypothetical protein K8U03_05050 [Planctomycetia bacterium]|nr:hypothetical protein [Planctomycetia bacterium]